MPPPRRPHGSVRKQHAGITRAATREHRISVTGIGCPSIEVRTTTRAARAASNPASNDTIHVAGTAGVRANSTLMRIVHLANHAQTIGNGTVNMMVDLACMQARMGQEVVIAPRAAASSRSCVGTASHTFRCSSRGSRGACRR
ncbi:MAG: Glycosyltransferase [uncultured Caballeronia sp.]|nr:MAG: Glycosyltransferase [uncultured Caballeronia sp.]